ncbi:MAG: PIG-L deacetylase family protein [Pseudomonadota bacterium]
MAGKRVMVVAAHADDETLGCGGTIARHAAVGDEVSVVFMTDGVGARDANMKSGGATDAGERDDAAKAALAALGVTRFHRHSFPDNAMDQTPLLTIAKALEADFAEVRPQTVYTHHHGDLNVDHRATHEAVMTALRPQPGLAVETILSFEVMSSTEWRAPSAATAFIPDWHVDISETLEAKTRALAAYEAEMREWPHSRSIAALEHLARHRGATMGVAAAEAFKLIRAIR